MPSQAFIATPTLDDRRRGIKPAKESNRMTTPTPQPEDKLSRLFLNGTVILLSIGQYRWTTKLTPEMIQNAYRMDLQRLQTQLTKLESELTAQEESAKLRQQIDDLSRKIEDATKLPDNFDLGRVFLIPEERIKKIDHLDNLARGVLDRASFDFEFDADSRAKFRWVHEARIEELHEELGALRKRFFDEVDLLLADYDSIKAQMEAKYPAQWPLLKVCYPAKEQIRAKYKFSFPGIAMHFPQVFDKLNLKDVQRRNAADQEYRQKKEQSLQEQRQQMSRRAEAFIEGVLKSLRGKVVDVFQGLLQKIQEGKEITDVNVKSLHQVFAHVEKMDFLNDADFRTQLRKVRAQLDNHRTFKNNQSAVKALEEVLQGTVEFVSKTTDSAAAAASRDYFQRDLDI